MSAAVAVRGGAVTAPTAAVGVEGAGVGVAVIKAMAKLRSPESRTNRPGRAMTANRMSPR